MTKIYNQKRYIKFSNENNASDIIYSSERWSNTFVNFYLNCSHTLKNAICTENEYVFSGASINTGLGARTEEFYIYNNTDVKIHFKWAGGHLDSGVPEIDVEPGQKGAYDTSLSQSESGILTITFPTLPVESGLTNIKGFVS